MGHSRVIPPPAWHTADTDIMSGNVLYGQLPQNQLAFALDAILLLHLLLVLATPAGRLIASPRQSAAKNPNITAPVCVSRYADVSGAVDRSCWRPLVPASAADCSAPDGQQPDEPDGDASRWDSLPPAAYLRAAHSPNIEELVGHDTEPLTL